MTSKPKTIVEMLRESRLRLETERDALKIKMAEARSLRGPERDDRMRMLREWEQRIKRDDWGLADCERELCR